MEGNPSMQCQIQLRWLTNSVLVLLILFCASCAEEEKQVDAATVQNIVYASMLDEKMEIFTARTDGKTLFDQRQLTRNDAFDAGPRWSPDSSRIAFYSTRSGRSQIYSSGPTGSDLVQLTAVKGEAYTPSWSPDGKRIAYAVQEPLNASLSIYVMNADGSRPRRIIGSPNFEPSWSPDGSRIAVSSGSNLGGIRVFDTNGIEVELPRPTDMLDLIFCYSPNWSPDGNQIMYTQRFYDDSSLPSSDVFLLSLKTGERLRLTDEPGIDVGLDWSPDGSLILITSNRDGNGELYTIGVDGSHPHRLTHSNAYEYLASWGSDG